MILLIVAFANLFYTAIVTTVIKIITFAVGLCRLRLSLAILHWTTPSKMATKDL